MAAAYLGWVCECFENIKVFQGSFEKGEILNSEKFNSLFPGLDNYARQWIKVATETFTAKWSIWRFK